MRFAKSSGKLISQYPPWQGAAQASSSVAGKGKIAPNILSRPVGSGGGLMRAAPSLIFCFAVVSRGTRGGHDEG
jgi:hypothetical protein